jgi:sphingomyelin phosphodiesterase 2
MYEAQRITECWQIANSVRSSAAQGRHVILAGDFNSIPTSNCYQILSHHGFMTDSWLELHEQSIKENQERLERREITPKECIQLFGITCDSPVNTWTKHLFKQEAYVREVGDRLDYIYYRRTPQITCQQSNVVMDDYIPNTEINFSDHYGVHSIFTINSSQASSSEEEGQFAPIASQVARPDVTKLSTSTLCTCIDILQKDQQQAKATSNGLLTFSVFSLMVVLAAFIAQIVLPTVYYDNQQSMILSSALCGFFMIIFTLLAMITLVVGFVFGRMEQRTLSQYLIDFQVYLETLQSRVTRTEVSHITQDNNSYSSSFSSSTTQEGLITKHT